MKTKPRPWVLRAAEASSPGNEAGFHIPQKILQCGGGAGAAGGRAARAAAAEGRRAWPAAERRHNYMLVSGAAAEGHSTEGRSTEGRSTAVSQQTRVMRSRQLEKIASGSDVPLAPKAPDEFLSIYF